MFGAEGILPRVETMDGGSVLSGQGKGPWIQKGVTLMKQNQSFPLAWCVELERRVTPYEAHMHQLTHGQEKLTYRCLVCRKALFLVYQRRGFLKHPIFKRSAKERHVHCPKLLYQEHVGKGLKYHLDFEDTLATTASTAKKLESLIKHLEILCHSYRESTNPFHHSRSSLGLTLDLILTHAKQDYAALEETLRKLEECYKTAQLS